MLCALAPSAAWLIVWRFLQGASGGGGIVLARAIAADIASGVAAARLFSLFMTLSSVAPIVAPVLGGLLLAWTGSWQPMFYLLAAISLVLAAVTWRVIPETLPAERRHRGGLRQTGRAFAGLARDRVFAGYALTVAFAYASLFGYISGSSFVLQDLYGLSATEFSLVFALNAAGMIVLGLLNARLVRRFPVRGLLMVGLAGSSVAAVVAAGHRAGAGLGLVAVLVPLFLVVATRGLVSANATVLGVQRAPAAGVGLRRARGAACSAAASWSPRCWRSAARAPRCRWRPWWPAARWPRCWPPRCSPGPPRIAEPAWDDAQVSTSFHSRISSRCTTPCSTNGSSATNDSAASRVVKTAIEPSRCGSANVPTISSSPRRWNSSMRAECAGKCAGARSSTSSAGV